MEIVKVLTCLTVLAFASAGAAFADDSLLTPANPNCSPGVKGCTANYPTADVSKTNPYDAKGNPNCSPGQQGCSANYATTDHSDASPSAPSKPAN